MSETGVAPDRDALTPDGPAVDDPFSQESAIMMQRLWNLAAFAVLATLAAPSARAGFDTYLYQAGHADVAVGYEGGALELFYELSGTARVNGALLGGAGISASPSDVSVIVPETVLTTGNAALPSPFAGNPLYLLSQSSAGAATRPFLGFGAEEIGSGVFADDTLSLSLTGFSTTAAGGAFVLYTTGLYGSPAMNSADGLSTSDAIDLFAGGHDHYNLGFTAAGIYDLTFTASGTLVGGGSLTASAVYRFVVGDQTVAVPEPSALAMAGLAVACGGLAAARRRRG